MKEDDIIKVGFLASYDYELLKIAIPLIYKQADIIYIAIDINRQTWTGTNFHLNDNFFDWIKEIDSIEKINIYEDNFYSSSLSPMENETKERNMLAERMGVTGWHIQLDADEYFLNFEKFVDFLRNTYPLLPFSNEPVCIYTKLVTLYKKVNGGYLYIKSNETAPIATKHPIYSKARAIGQNILITSSEIIHQSWARSEEEILEKLSSWGHKQDFNIQSYYNLWNVCDRYNYIFFNNFNPVNPELWDKLHYGSGKDISEFTRSFPTAATSITYKYHPLLPVKRTMRFKPFIKRLLKSIYLSI